MQGISIDNKYHQYYLDFLILSFLITLNIVIIISHINEKLNMLILLPFGVDDGLNI